MPVAALGMSYGHFYHPYGHLLPYGAGVRLLSKKKRKMSNCQAALADKAFAEYEFGDGDMVTDTSGWEYTTSGHERTRKVYVETEREDDGPTPRWV